MKIPRQARKKSQTGIYHIMLRGINRQTIFEERYGVKKRCFHLLERKNKDVILRNLKAINGVTIRQLVRVTGVSKYIVEKV